MPQRPNNPRQVRNNQQHSGKQVLKPSKAIIQLTGRYVDSDNETVGERVMGEFVIYAPRFKDATQLIEKAWKEAEDQIK